VRGRGPSHRRRNRAEVVQAGYGIAVDEADAWMAEFDDLERAGAFLFAMNRFLFVARKPN
jgi:hypothetical protein